MNLLIRVELDTGESELLITSLTDKEKYLYDLFAELCHLGWPVEKDYKTLKYRLQVENFSGKSVPPVYQDFHAKILSKNFSAVVASTTRKEIEKKGMRCKYPQQINFTQALSKMKNTIVSLFNRPFQLLEFIISKIQKIFIQTTESVRTGRKFPRNHKVKQKHFHYPYKQIT